MIFKKAKRLLNDHKKDLSKLGVRALSLFGSVARDESTSKSDIDVLIDFDSKRGLFGFVDVKNYLEKLFHCDVDLVTKNSLHPALRKRILSEAKHVFLRLGFWVQDILQAIDKIERFLKRKTFYQFKKKELVIDAVLRNLEIIGEASKSIPVSIKRQHPNIPWGQMAGMRNILIHKYFGVDLNVVWLTVKKSLPSLKKQLKQLSGKS